MTERSRPATLEEVARKAGMSRATVSRVINGNPKVSHAAREAVQAAIDQLGYAPNRAARSLVTRRNDSIGLVAAESEQRVFGEPFFSSLVSGVSAELAGTDVHLVLLLTRSDHEREQTERFLASHVDGVLLVSAHADDPLLEKLATLGIPTMLAGRPPEPTRLPYVDVDNAGGAREAVEHLLERGRRSIATIAGPQDMAPGVDRLEGYRAALADAGVPCVEQLIVYGDFSFESGEAAAEKLIEVEPELDAIFAASDLMAAGALRALDRAGLRVPEDVALIGFDNSMIAETARPPLTSVHQPVEQIGKQLIELLRRILDDDGPVPRKTILPTHLVVRAST